MKKVSCLLVLLLLVNVLCLGVAGTVLAASIPQYPTNLTATAVSGTEINLSWSDNSHNELGFKIVGANTTVYASTGLSAGTTYYYRVRAYNAAGDSAYSNEKGTATTGTTTTTGGAKTSIVLNVGKTDCYVNNRRQAMDAAPIIAEARTFLPIRYVAEV